MKQLYDICIYFDANYLCSGSFYDSFEYYYLFKQKGYNICFIVMSDVTPDVVYFAITDKYDVDIEPLKKDIYVYNKKEYARSINIIRTSSNILFIPSMSSAAQMFYFDILIPKRKIVTIWELPQTHKFIKAFETKRDNILMLYDDRVFETYRDYPHKKYRRSLYFDIMKPLINPSRKSCMFNMVTDHKCYPAEDVADFMDKYKFDHYTITTKDKWYEKYKVLESDKVDVLTTPIEDYMYKFDTLLYLPSVRGMWAGYGDKDMDPSPRLLPECKWFEKKVIYHDFGKLKDGGYWRWIDCMDDFDSLILTLDDEIFDIIEDWR